MADERSWIDPSTAFFFKPLNPGFLTDLCIPISFMKYLKLGDSKSFQATLKNASSKPGKNGEVKSWIVMIDSDGRRFMDGWKEFAESQHLCVGQFLVFRHLGDFTFDVLVFDGVTGCLLPAPAEATEATEASPERVKFKPSGYPYFQTSVKKYCFQWQAQLIPMDFARQNNLAKRWCDVTVIDQQERAWPVHLRHRQTGKDQAYLASGWDKLRDAHKLKIGDAMVFELIVSGSHPVFKFYTWHSFNYVTHKIII